MVASHAGGCRCSGFVEFNTSVLLRLDDDDAKFNCIKDNTDVITNPTATMTRCATDPVTPNLVMACLQVTLSALCATHDTMAATKPKISNVGASQDAAAMPVAMGIKVNRVGRLGKASIPSNKIVKRTVTNGMLHLQVYVREIPIRSKLIELE
jgi:hypothetical protein